MIIRYPLSRMQANALTRDRPQRGAGARALLVAAAVVALATPVGAQEQAAGERARVPTSYANVHDSPSTASNLLLLVPEGTELPIIDRRGEWVQVQLSPDLRQTGMIVRWYEGRREFVRRGQSIVVGDEDSGWMHDSTVEILPVAPQ